ncbi:PASTA domain-containing protein [Aeromicrobium sp. UC242_57]|uniref:PASTA domain-containing protein n=1 Tax=Aeromicrobium sp. UC242_57 TaxID=3374624 RepID=UPI0037B0E4F5
MSLDDAQRTLTRDGFTIGEVTEQASADVEKDDVIETDPPGGTKADEGSAVNIVVSSGPETQSMPDVRGLPYNNAKSTLEGAPYNFKVVRKNVDNTAAKGEVINTTPTPGADVQVGAEVTVFVSKGQVQVPNLVGMDIEAAKGALDDLGLKYTETEDPNSTSPENQVTAQSVAAGTQVSPGTTIALTYSTNPGTDDGDGDGGEIPTDPTDPGGGGVDDLGGDLNP